MPDVAGAAREHWDDLYARRPVEQASWFQAEPTVSLELIDAAAADVDAAVIDVGGGASVLAERLLTRGFKDVTVLDVSAEALSSIRERMGSESSQVEWVDTDLLRWQPPRQYDLWHDRAAFHFLTTEEERQQYAGVLRAALAPAGSVVIGTFALDGPERCSGLPVSRYGPDDLARQFPWLRVLATRREEHHTPGGTVQPFSWLLLSGRAN